MKNTYTLVLGLSMLMGVHSVGLAQQQRDWDCDKMGWELPLRSDSQFVDRAISGQNLEVKLGGLAAEKGSDSFTKSMGKMLVHDHVQAPNQLQLIHNTRRSYGLIADQLRNFRQNLTDDDERSYDRIANLSGTEFDRAFRWQVIEDHKMHLKMFKMEATHGTDQELRQYASNCIPIIRKHLESLRDQTIR